MATTNSFEFLNQAKVRYDGGPEIEWINWIEEQRDMAKAQRSVMAKRMPQDVLLVAEAQLIEGRQQQMERVSEENTGAVRRNNRPVLEARSLKQPVASKSIWQVLHKPFEVLGLGLCGLFISTIMFHVLMSPSRKAKKGYQAQNELVFKSSLASIKKSLWAIVALPTSVMHHLYSQMA